MGGLPGQLLYAGKPIGLGIEGRLEAANRRRAVAQHLPGPGHPFGLQAI